MLETKFFVSLMIWARLISRRRVWLAHFRAILEQASPYSNRYFLVLSHCEAQCQCDKITDNK